MSEGDSDSTHDAAGSRKKGFVLFFFLHIDASELKEVKKKKKNFCKIKQQFICSFICVKYNLNYYYGVICRGKSDITITILLPWVPF